MGNIPVACPKCHAEYSVEESHLGKKGQCARCYASFRLTRLADLETRMHLAEVPPEPVDTSAHLGVEDDVPQLWDVGDVIVDVYEVRNLSDELPYAEGGMGIVYRVHHLQWDLDVAVKSPKPETFQTERGKQSFESECKTWMQLGLHPHTVSCYYVRRLGGIPRVFAEFVEDGALSDWIRDRRLYEGGLEAALRRILDIAIQFTWGLQHAHRHGLIHQDVKPGNVMMQGELAKVTDFGLAKAQAAATLQSRGPEQEDATVTWGGMTPAYCSPEQKQAAIEFEGGLPDEQQTKLTLRTDVWSWAVSILAMFHGKAPCRRGGHTAAKAFEAFLKRPQGEDHRPAMPDGLIALLRQCFQENPDDRPENMSAVAEVLKEIYRDATGEAYARQEPITAELRASSLNNQAASLLDLGRQDEAERLLDEAWEHEPWEPHVTYNRGLLAWRSGRLTDLDLVSHLEQLIRTRPDDWTTNYSLGLVQLERGNIPSAISALDEAMACHEQHEIAVALEKCRQFETIAPSCIQYFPAWPVDLPAVFHSLDNRWLLSAAEDETLRLWETTGGRPAVTFHAPPSGETTSLSADLQWELSTEDNQTLRLCEVASGRCVRNFQPVDWGTTTELRSKDEQWHLSANEDFALELRSEVTGKLLRTFIGHTALVSSIFLSHDMQWVLSGSCDKTIRLWEVASGRCLRTFRGHSGPVHAVYLSEDGSWALSGGGEGRMLRLWNTQLLCDREQRPSAPILLCNVTSSEEAIRTQTEFADLASKAREAAVDGRYAEALDMVRSARDLPGYEADRKSLDLWRLVGSHSICKESLNALCVHILQGHTQDVRSVAMGLDSRWAFSASWDQTIRQWDVGTGQCVRTFEGHLDSVRSIQVGNDGRHLLSGSWDRTLRLWDVDSGQCLRTFEGHSKNVTSVCLGVNGRMALSGSWDGTMRLWELATGRCLRTFAGHDGYVTSVAISGDGRLALSGSEDQTLRLWDVATGQCRRTLTGHEAGVTDARLTADGRFAISAGNDGTLRVWNLKTGRCDRVMTGHGGRATALCISADGLWALSGCSDGSIRLWEVATGRCCRTIEGHTGLVTSVFLSPDGRWGLSGGEDESLRIWEFEWDYIFPDWADWHPAARPYLETFLTLHDDLFDPGHPTWNELDFERLTTELQYRGFGWLRPKGVKQQLEQMAADWQGPPPLPGE